MTSKSFFVALVASLVLAPVMSLAPVKAYVMNAPVLISPSVDQVLTNYPRNATFSWNAVSGATSYELEVACDVCVSEKNKWQGAKTYTVSGTSYTTLAPGSDNQFRWRVKANNSTYTGVWSEYRYFRFKTGSSNTTKLGTPVITSPYNGQKISTIPTEIRWSSVSSATSYNYELQSYDHPSDTWWNYINGSKDSTLYEPALNHGHYRIRVKAVNGSVSGDWSIWTFFDVGSPDELGEEFIPPTLLSPQDETTVLSNNVHLVWSYLDGGWDSYEYQVTKFNGSTWDAILSGTVAESNDAYVTLPAGSYGKYSFRVRSSFINRFFWNGSTPEVVYSAWSDYFQFYYINTSPGISYDIPSIVTPYAGQNLTSHDVNISWNTGTLNGVSGYEVNVQYKSGSNWYEERTQSTGNKSLSVYVPYDNTYRARVRIKFSDYNYGSWSDWREFSVGSGSGSYTTNPPTISSPYENQYYGSGSSVSMNWSSVASAEKYEVSVEYESNSSWYNEGTYTVYSNNYTKYFGYNNNYRMRIRAVFSGGSYTNWSDYRKFSVGQSGSYSTTAPTLYAPTSNQNFSVGSYVTIGWYAPASSAGISSYEVGVEYQSGGNWYAEGTYSTTNLSYQKYFGSTNSYRVKVRALHSDSSYTSWSDYRYFTTGSSQSYSAPTISTPADNQSFSNYSTVSVNWNTLSSVLKYEVGFEYQSGSNWLTEGTYFTTGNNYSKYFSLENAYRVRVRAQYNDYTYSNWSDYRNFTIGAQSTIYDVPTISTPAVNQVYSNGSVAVDWNDVTMALRYEMTVEYQSGGNWYTETNYTNLTSSYQQLSLFYKTNYRIKVRAVFVQDTGAWSEYRYFSVQ